MLNTHVVIMKKNIICMKTIILLILSNLLTISVAKPTFEPLIVNGRDSTIQKYPYQVSIRCYGYHCCGGAIVTPYHVVTAAHCLYPCKKSDIRTFYSVVAGSSISWLGKEIPIADCACHNKFSKNTSDFDVAVIKLRNKLPLSRYIKPINLAPTNYKITEKPAVISGWGRTKENGDLPDVLQAAKVKLVPHTMCAKIYARYRKITKNMLCATLVTKDNKVVDSCQGDSGGPMKQEKYLIGIISWGIGCARRSFPGVYTKISNFNGWIQYNINHLG